MHNNRDNNCIMHISWLCCIFLPWYWLRVILLIHALSSGRKITKSNFPDSEIRGKILNYIIQTQPDSIMTKKKKQSTWGRTYYVNEYTQVCRETMLAHG